LGIVETPENTALALALIDEPFGWKYALMRTDDVNVPLL
jgi:hypothetical protein